jgi:hypothetical protein
MPVLDALVAALRLSAIEVIDLTAPLSADTPVIKLPEPFGNTIPLSLQEISRYDDRGPGWYWNNISTEEHTGTTSTRPCTRATGRDGPATSRRSRQAADPLQRRSLDFSGATADRLPARVVP